MNANGRPNSIKAYKIHHPPAFLNIPITNGIYDTISNNGSAESFLKIAAMLPLLEFAMVTTINMNATAKSIANSEAQDEKAL